MGEMSDETFLRLRDFHAQLKRDGNLKGFTLVMMAMKAGLRTPEDIAASTKLDLLDVERLLALGRREGLIQ